MEGKVFLRIMFVWNWKQLKLGLWISAWLCVLCVFENLCAQIEKCVVVAWKGERLPEVIENQVPSPPLYGPLALRGFHVASRQQLSSPPGSTGGGSLVVGVVLIKPRFFVPPWQRTDTFERLMLVGNCAGYYTADDFGPSGISYNKPLCNYRVIICHRFVREWRAWSSPGETNTALGSINC